jgi:hypothetical protein
MGHLWPRTIIPEVCARVKCPGRGCPATCNAGDAFISWMTVIPVSSLQWVPQGGWSGAVSASSCSEREIPGRPGGRQTSPCSATAASPVSAGQPAPQEHHGACLGDELLLKVYAVVGDQDLAPSQPQTLTALALHGDCIAAGAHPHEHYSLPSPFGRGWRWAPCNGRMVRQSHRSNRPFLHSTPPNLSDACTGTP